MENSWYSLFVGEEVMETVPLRHPVHRALRTGQAYVQTAWCRPDERYGMFLRPVFRGGYL